MTYMFCPRTFALHDKLLVLWYILPQIPHLNNRTSKRDSKKRQKFYNPNKYK